MVEFFPQKGSELSKRRPAIVVSHDTIGRLPLKTIVPLTDWKSTYASYPWMIRFDPNRANGLSKPSAADCFQIKNFDDSRFIERIGIVERLTLKQIHDTIAKTLDPLYTLSK